MFDWALPLESVQLRVQEMMPEVAAETEIVAQALQVLATAGGVTVRTFASAVVLSFFLKVEFDPLREAQLGFTLAEIIFRNCPVLLALQFVPVLPVFPIFD